MHAVSATALRLVFNEQNEIGRQLEARTASRHASKSGRCNGNAMTLTVERQGRVFIGRIIIAGGARGGRAQPSMKRQAVTKAKASVTPAVRSMVSLDKAAP